MTNKHTKGAMMRTTKQKTTKTTKPFDIVSGLRNIADSIEKGEYGKVHDFAWVMDRGGGQVDIGLLGTKEPSRAAAYAYLLYGIGQRKLEDAVGLK